MSGFNQRPKTVAGRIGKKIYEQALYDRRGFRDDQLGIEDREIWSEIFEAIGQAAIAATSNVKQ
jgi:hypothetical protein